MATGYGYAEEFGRSTSRENSVSRRGMKELSFTLSSLKSTILRNPLKAGIRLGDYNWRSGRFPDIYDRIS